MRSNLEWQLATATASIPHSEGTFVTIRSYPSCRMRQFLSLSRRQCKVHLTDLSCYVSIRRRNSLFPMIHHHVFQHFSTMLLLSETNVRQCLDMQECININRKALISIATGDAMVPTRLGLPYRTVRSDSGETSIDDADDWTLVKPASLQKTESTNTETISMGMKVVSIRADNVHTGHPLVPATVIHINPHTGIVDAIVAATYLTAARTAAGSAIAIHHYFNAHTAVAEVTVNETSPPLRPQHVVVFGAGLQAEQHIRAISCIFQYSIPRVTIINRNTQRAELLRDRIMSEELASTISIEPLISQKLEQIERTILLSADVIVTCTNTITPLWGTTIKRDDLKLLKDTEQWANRFCIIAGIGSYTPSMQEIPRHVVDACQQIWIDTPEATKVGDLKHLSSQSDSCSAQRSPRLLGSVLSHQPGRNHIDCQRTQHIGGLVFYKAVGTAIQDILTADAIIDKARRLDIGTDIDMS